MIPMDSFVDFLLRPFVAAMLLSYLVGQVMTRAVFTKERAASKGRWGWFWKWSRKTLALHPVIAGVVVGLAWPGTIEGDYTGGTISGVLYFAAAGGLSVWGHEMIKGLGKEHGIDLDASLPGLSSPPEDPDKTPVP